MEFLEEKSTIPTIKPGNEDGSIRLEVYFNKAGNVVYAQRYKLILKEMDNPVDDFRYFAISLQNCLE